MQIAVVKCMNQKKKDVTGIKAKKKLCLTNVQYLFLCFNIFVHIHVKISDDLLISRQDHHWAVQPLIIPGTRHLGGNHETILIYVTLLHLKEEKKKTLIQCFNSFINKMWLFIKQHNSIWEYKIFFLPSLSLILALAIISTVIHALAIRINTYSVHHDYYRYLLWLSQVPVILTLAIISNTYYGYHVLYLLLLS